VNSHRHPTPSIEVMIRQALHTCLPVCPYSQTCHCGFTAQRSAGSMALRLDALLPPYLPPC
jgi:hypothetical protein